MEENKVHDLYKKTIQDGLNPNVLLKISGVMTEKDHPEAEFVQAESLFLNGRYEECVQFCKYKRSNTSYAINEFYIISLLMLERFSDVLMGLKYVNKYPISKYCFMYIRSYMEIKDRYVPKDVKCASFENSDFKRDYFNFAFNQLMTVYEQQKEILTLSNLGADKDLMKSAEQIFLRIINSIHIPPYENAEKQLIEKSIIEGIGIDSRLIYQFFLRGFSFDQLRDITKLIDVERRLGLYTELDNTLIQKGELIAKSIEEGNKNTANYIMELVLDAEEMPDVLSEKGKAVILNCKNIIEKVFPDLIDYGKHKASNTQVYKYLSDRSKIIMEAAVWQYNAVVSDEYYGYRDAGMFCLSYIRILELEMNERILPAIRLNAEEFQSMLSLRNPTGNKKEEEFILGLYNDLPDKEPEKVIKKRWKDHKKDIQRYNAVWKNLEKACKSNTNGLTAGEWNYFFRIFCEDQEARKEDELYIKLRDCLQKNVFNEKGIQALESGRIASFFANSTVQEFRNPPAHSRYVMRKTADKCKKHVEETIAELYTYYR